MSWEHVSFAKKHMMKSQVNIDNIINAGIYGIIASTATYVDSVEKSL